ncbi:acetyl-coenzyme A carboxylase carboxyltransferase subunit beta [Striga asiatica]|uniref:Acetyl-coenzyme A carboxylase carboxyltransferase subunit beta n=1 Tax=Striga asiatica TaxID=4170 RepID=A0A5A7Q5K3_STRAF|nr:acetyl-coenzyme A carboxylase carboxyltransferase subunit beta [Striga asiatica]
MIINTEISANPPDFVQAPPPSFSGLTTSFPLSSKFKFNSGEEYLPLDKKSTDTVKPLPDDQLSLLLSPDSFNGSDSSSVLRSGNPHRPITSSSSDFFFLFQKPVIFLERLRARDGLPTLVFPCVLAAKGRRFAGKKTFLKAERADFGGNRTVVQHCELLGKDLKPLDEHELMSSSKWSFSKEGFGSGLVGLARIKLESIEKMEGKQDISAVSHGWGEIWRLKTPPESGEKEREKGGFFALLIVGSKETPQFQVSRIITRHLIIPTEPPPQARRRRHQSPLRQLRHNIIILSRVVLRPFIRRRSFLPESLGSLGRAPPQLPGISRRRHRQPPHGVGEVEARCPAPQGQGRHIVGPRGHLGSRVRPEPHPALLGGLPKLANPLSGVPHPHATVHGVTCLPEFLPPGSFLGPARRQDEVVRRGRRCFRGVQIG